MFPLSKRNMNSNIDLTMICNKNHHIKMYDQKVKIVLFTVKIVKNFCTRLAWAFPEKNSIIRAYFDSRALQSSHSYWIPQRQRVREYYRSSRRKNESYNFYPKWVITKKFLAIHRLPDLHDSTALTLFLFGPRLRARRVFIQSSGRLGLVVWYLRQVFISYLHLQIITNFAKF